MKIQKTYNKPLMISVVLHLVLISVLFIDIASPNPSIARATPVKQQQIIAAVSVNQQQVEQEVNKLKQQRAEKKLAEQRYQDQLKQQAERAKRERIKEQQRVAKLKKQIRAKQLLEKRRLAKIQAEKRQAKADLAKLKRQQAKIAKQKAAELKRLQALKAKKLAEQKAKAAELAKAKAEQLARAKQLQMAAQQKTIDKYKALILEAIARRWIVPENADKNLSCKFAVRLAPNGTVLSVSLTQSSGDPVLDRSAQAAVYKASPLPVPSEPDLFAQFRTLNLTVRPERVLSAS